MSSQFANSGTDSWRVTCIVYRPVKFFVASKLNIDWKLHQFSTFSCLQVLVTARVRTRQIEARAIDMALFKLKTVRKLVSTVMIILHCLYRCSTASVSLKPYRIRCSSVHLYDKMFYKFSSCVSHECVLFILSRSTPPVMFQPRP